VRHQTRQFLIVTALILRERGACLQQRLVERQVATCRPVDLDLVPVQSRAERRQGALIVRVDAGAEAGSHRLERCL
jgi:hypothetical protein